MVSVSQTYETEIIHDSGITFRAVIVPARSMCNQGFLSEPSALGEALGLELLDEFDRESAQRALVSVLSADTMVNLQELFHKVSIRQLLQQEATYAEFSDYIFTAPTIPFERSPLRAESLSDILTKVGGYGVEPPRVSRRLVGLSQAAIST